MYEILRDVSHDLIRVQQNVAKEFARVEANIPSLGIAPRFITSDALMQPADVLVLATASADINVTLPPSRACAGQRFIIKNRSPGPFVVHLRGALVNGNPETIDGSSPYDLATGPAITLYSTGVGWETL